MQQVKRIVLTGVEQAITFDYLCGKYLVKNFSSADIFVSFNAETPEEKSIKIPSESYQIVIVNEYLGSLEAYERKQIYIKGTGEIEVQQLCFH